MLANRCACWKRAYKSLLTERLLLSGEDLVYVVLLPQACLKLAWGWKLQPGASLVVSPCSAHHTPLIRAPLVRNILPRTRNQMRSPQYLPLLNV